jgi:hypothetical protein
MGTIADGDTLRGILASGINATDSSDLDLTNALTRSNTRYVKLAADGAAATATASITFDAAPRGQRLQRVIWLPEGPLVADNTNYATLQILKRTGVGGDVIMATAATQITGTGSWIQGVAVPFVLSTVQGAIIMAANDSIRFAITKTGTGVIVGAGLLFGVVEIL